MAEIKRNFKSVGIKILCFITALICIFACRTDYVNTVLASESLKLYLGGYVAGFTINTKGAEVIGISDVVTESGVVAPAKDAGILPSDIIISIGGIETNSYDDINTALEASKGKPVIISLERSGEIMVKEVTPVKDLSGKYKLGVYVRDRLSGIGTITYFRSDNVFMALGHSICRENGVLINIRGGDLFRCNVIGVMKGERGKAGEIRGFNLEDVIIGNVTENLPVGIKGTVNDNFDKTNLKEVCVGEAKVGTASMYATINGDTPTEFSIEIVKIDGNAKDNRNFVIKITDSNLLEVAGGIVQGMSGSPIVQDGKIVGAVTHVFLNDPTRGYAIDINKMLVD